MTRNTPKQVVATSFKYDPFGRRIEKRVATTNILSTKTSVIIHEYLYDNEDIVEEIITKPRPQRDIVEETRFVHGPGIDEPLAFSGKQGEYFFHADGLGSITALTDHGGGLAQRYEYSAFGTRKKHDSGVDSFYSYTGREWDSETGLYYYRARYYDSAAGRFIGKDPIGFAGGDVNLYRYVQNNPVNFVDPWGLKPGDPYPTVDLAGANAVNDINYQSIKEGREYGGRTYQNPDGTYSYTPPIPGTKDSVSCGDVPSGTKNVGDYHTHGAPDPGYDNENFSPADKQGNNDEGVKGYLGTPQGVIKRYDPSTGKTINLPYPK